MSVLSISESLGYEIELFGGRSALMDVNGDGDDEVIHYTSNEGSDVKPDIRYPVMVVDFRNGRPVDITHEVFPATVSAVLTRNFIVADFNGDGRDDLYLNNYGTEANFLGEQNRLVLSSPEGYLDVTATNLPALRECSHGYAAADFDGDGDVDVYVNETANGSYLLLNDGSGNFAAPEFLMSSDRFNPEPLYWGTVGYHPDIMDWDDDGDFDIYLGDIYDTKTGADLYRGTAVLVNDGTAHFETTFFDSIAAPFAAEELNSAISDPNAGIYPQYTRSGDIDNDGDLDLLVYYVRYNSSANFVYFQYLENKGAAGYVDSSVRIEGQEAGGRLPVQNGTPEFKLVDFDADGDLDFVTAGWTEDWSEWLNYWYENDGTGSFKRIDQRAFPGFTSVNFTDVNGDHIPDLTEATTGYLEVYLGKIENAVRRVGFLTDDTIAGGQGADYLSGLAGNDALHSNGNNDTLLGGTGQDLLDGGSGDDRLQGGVDRDRLFGGSGGDTADFGDKTAAVVVTLNGANAVSAQVGGAAEDTLKGVENLRGGSGADRLTGDTLNNQLFGGSGADTLRGNGGNDRLDGGTGADRLEGGAGNDIYVLAASGDTVVEVSGAGTDEVQAGYSLTLGANLENLLLTGSANLNGMGNSLANRLTGNLGANTLKGGDGNDNLLGGGGNDRLEGGAGNDRLDGGSGTDRLEGGLGSDTYFLATSGDTVVEAAGGGTDTVQAAYSITLGAHVERLLLTGTANLNGTGNASANALSGNSGANTLRGGGGADTLAGGGGKDWLDGGADGSVRDVFVFSDKSHSAVGVGRDTIENFRPGVDDIDLRGMDAREATTTNETFAWGGTSAKPYAVWWQATTGGVILKADTDGTFSADFELLLKGVASLHSSDVLL